MNKTIFFKRVENFITDEQYLGFFKFLRENANDYLYTTAASSTGKHHSIIDLGIGGLYRHSDSVARMMIYFLGLDMYSSKFEEWQKNALVIAAAMHDSKKLGDNGSSFTLETHPNLAAAWLIEMNKKYENQLPEEQIMFMANCCAAHSGQWCNSYRGQKKICPIPGEAYGTFEPVDAVTELGQQLTHLSDYVASREDILIQFGEDEITEPELTEEDVIIPFGKYKGISFKEVKRDADYVQWLWSEHCNPDNKRLNLVEPMLSFVHAFVDNPTEDEEENIDEWEI